MVNHWSKKVVAQDKLAAELDARFALMPGYLNLRKFKDGILSLDHAWSVYEYKAMMKVIVGAVSDLCPPEGLDLLMEYLHIHYLSHYAVHTDESLEWLSSAVFTFTRLLLNPVGAFVINNLVEPDYDPQRLHYMLHYAHTVRMKGALPSYSTELTEIHHLPLKRAFRRSNKRQEHAIKFVLRDQTTLAAFQKMVDDFQVDTAEAVVGDSDDSDSESQLQVEEEMEDDREARSRLCGTRIYTWPKQRRPGWPMRAEKTENELSLPGLTRAILHYFKDSTIEAAALSNIDPDPLIYVYDSLRVKYPSWIEEEVGTIQISSATDPSSNLRVPPKEHYLPGSAKTISERIKCAPVGKGRRDAVLVTRPTQQGDAAMRGWKVAQVLLLFKCRQFMREEQDELAFVSLFDTKKKASVTSNKMYLLKRSTKFTVINVKDIERPVHLIPKFGSDVGNSVEVKRRLDQAQESLRLNDIFNTNGLGNSDGEDNQSEASTQPVLDSMAYYSEFWLNNWIDANMYKRIY